jgi:hypothetical protein
MKRIFDLITLPDFFLILFLLIFAGLMSIQINSDLNKSQVIITKANDFVGSYYLTDNKVIEIDKNVAIEIKNGKVRMLRSDCSHQYCVRQGWNDLMPIICVPNQIVISIKSKEDILITR